jgi:hypothetical protein
LTKVPAKQSIALQQKNHQTTQQQATHPEPVSYNANAVFRSDSPPIPTVLKRMKKNGEEFKLVEPSHDKESPKTLKAEYNPLPRDKQPTDSALLDEYRNSVFSHQHMGDVERPSPGRDMARNEDNDDQENIISQLAAIQKVQLPDIGT